MRSIHWNKHVAFCTVNSRIMLDTNVLPFSTNNLKLLLLLTCGPALSGLSIAIPWSKQLSNND